MWLSSFVRFSLVHKTTHADWLMSVLKWYDVGPTGKIRFSFGSDKFWRENLRADFDEI